MRAAAASRWVEGSDGLLYPLAAVFQPVQPRRDRPGVTSRWVEGSDGLLYPLAAVFQPVQPRRDRPGVISWGAACAARAARAEYDAKRKVGEPTARPKTKCRGCSRVGAWLRNKQCSVCAKAQRGRAKKNEGAGGFAVTGL